MINTAETNAKRNEYEFSSEHLPSFIRFVKERHLEGFANQQLKLIREYQLPLLRFFEDYSEEQVLNITIAGINDFFNAIINNEVLQYMASSRERWMQNQLPHLIDRTDISGEDITLISYIRKTALMGFVRSYTQDIETITAIYQELDDFFLRFNLYYGEAFSEIFKEKVREEAKVKENEERLRMAIESTGLGTWDYDMLTGKIILSERARIILGLNPNSELSFDQFLSNLNGQEKQQVEDRHRGIRENSNDQSNYEMEYCFAGIDDRQPRWLRVKGTVLRNSEGTAYRFLGTLLDVTEQKRTESLLKENEHRFELLADAMPQMVWIANVKGKVTYFNKQWLDFTNMPSENAKDEWGELMHKDDIANTRILWQQSLISGELFETEYRLKDKDGHYRWFLARALPARDDNGAIIQWFGTCTDIHEQKLAEESLMLQARVLESMEEGVSVSDEDGNILFTNGAEDRMFGYETGELIGKHVTIQNAYTPEENERIVSTVIERLKQRGQWTGEWHNKRKDGTTFYTFSHITALQAGNKNLFVCVQRDITEEKRAQEALLESEERFRTMADDAPMFVWVANEMANLTYYNRTLADYVGDRDKFLQGGWASITHPDDVSNVFDIYTKAMSDPQPFAVEARLRGGDDVYRWFLFKGTPRYHRNKFVGFIGTALDIEEQRQLTQELEQRVEKRTKDLIEINHKLERSNEELEQFAYVASHDLQEPLRKISAFGNILVTRYKPSIGDEGADLIGRMQSASERMRVLIDELLTYSRVSKQADKKPIDLSELIKEVMVDMETSIREKQALVEVDELGGINGNPMQIRQLFQNLISNSLKFSKPGEVPAISITSKKVKGKDSGLTIISGDEGRQFLLITVRDNGIGFEQQYAEKIFQVFQRLHGRTEYPGSGVGLSIVQKVIENHSGYIIAEGVPNEGACFKILLPSIDSKAEGTDS